MESTMTAIDAMQATLRMVDAMVRTNVNSVTHEESLIQPQPAGNCMNWVLGHLLAIYHNALPLLGQQPVLSTDELKPYVRGSKPLVDGSQALALPKLIDAWGTTHGRVVAGLAALDEYRLPEPAPMSPSGNPNETVHSLLLTIIFHQSYHSGQLGLLRRIAGKPGAVK